jgi:hypothetical protein
MKGVYILGLRCATDYCWAEESLYSPGEGSLVLGNMRPVEEHLAGGEQASVLCSGRPMRLVGGEDEQLAVLGELEVRSPFQRSSVRAITLNATTATTYERLPALGVGALMLGGISLVLQPRLPRLVLVAHPLRHKPTG